MSYCDGIISKAISDFGCGTPAAKGIERVGWLINRADIDFASVAFSETSKNVLTALPLRSGKKAYTVTQKGNTPFTGSKSSAVVGTYGVTTDNNIVFALLNNDKESSDIVDSLLQGEFVFIAEYKDKGADRASAFRVFGFYNGLLASACEHDPYGDAYAGAVVTLTESGAPQYALYLGENYTAGKTIIDGLVAPAA